VSGRLIRVPLSHNHTLPIILENYFFLYYYLLFFFLLYIFIFIFIIYLLLKELIYFYGFFHPPILKGKLIIPNFYKDLHLLKKNPIPKYLHKNIYPDILRNKDNLYLTYIYSQQLYHAIVVQTLGKI
jgi:hypothetical protein